MFKKFAILPLKTAMSAVAAPQKFVRDTAIRSFASSNAGRDESTFNVS
jgi:hypothetical protein